MYDTIIKLKGHLDVIIKNKHGRISEKISIGSNVIEARSKLIISRLLGSNQKKFTNFAIPPWTPPPAPDADWPAATRLYPDSVQFPFMNDRTLFDANPRTPEDGFTFGGIQQIIPGIAGLQDPFPSNANATNVSNAVFHPITEVTPANYRTLLYSLGITGMAFGNGGHLIRHPTTPASNYFKKLTTAVAPAYSFTTGWDFDNSTFILDASDSEDDYTRPAQPPSLVPGAEGYLPYGSTNRNIPGTTYTPVENGIVPWRESYSLTGDLQDNYWESATAVPHTVRNMAEEPNSTLYSETGRFCLDTTTGISYPTWKSVQFQCTVPVDTGLNQIRNFGYANRKRNLITEAGLICGENILVMSPDVRTVGPENTTTIGQTNAYGAYLWDIAGAVTGIKGALRKDFYSKATPEATYLNADGQLDVTGNNTWNLFARRCFGVLTKNSDYSFTFVWTLQA